MCSILNIEMHLFHRETGTDTQISEIPQKGVLHMDHKLDNIDRKIIEMLQKNARTPVKEIAKEVFLSSPAVSARIEKNRIAVRFFLFYP